MPAAALPALTGDEYGPSNGAQDGAQPISVASEDAGILFERDALF